jgi:hypothetical protein
MAAPQYKLIYDPANTGCFKVDNATGTALPYAQGSAVPVWDVANGTLQIRYSHNDNTPILTKVGYASVRISTDGGATYTTPASLADLITWVTAYMFVAGGGGGGNATAANQTSEINLLTQINAKVPAQGAAITADSMPVTMATDQVLHQGHATYCVIITPPISAGSAYADNDIVGGKLMLNGAMGQVNGTGTIASIYILDKANQKCPFDIFLFTGDPNNGIYTDNAGCAPNAADWLMNARKITVLATDYTTFGPAVGQWAVCDIRIDEEITGNITNSNIYALVVSHGTPTYGSIADLTFRFGFYQD